jgi:hypothetical protein
MDQQPRIGHRFAWRAKSWHITGLRLQHEKLEIAADDGDIDIISIDQFREELADGLLRRIVANRSGQDVVVDPAWVKDERETARLERQMREAILERETHEIQMGKTLKVARTAIEQLCKERGWEVPCERTLRNWRRDARGGTSMLSPQWFRCGNRQQGPDALLLESMEEVAAEALLRDDRFTLEGAWDIVEALYAKKCEGDEHRPPQPRGRYSIRQFKVFLRRVDWIEQMGSRLDPRTRRALTRVAVRPHTAELLWELVEMDASWLDIQVRNEDGAKIGRPILYAAVDVATGYPVGLVLTIQKPSVMPFVDCLRFMYFPKPDLDKKHGIKHRIELFAKPIKMNLDNGSEFVGHVATTVVRVLLGDSARCKPYSPQEKPHIERFFGIVRDFVRTQPGSILSAIAPDARNPPKSEKLLTLEELEGRLFRFIYDEYVFRMNELRSWKWGTALSPFDLVQEMKLSQMQPFPVSREEFEHAIHFKRETRVLQHDGIAFDGWTYHSEDLARFYHRHGHGSYEFSYSDVDAVTIYVHSADGTETAPAAAKQLCGLRVDRQTATALRKEMARAGELLNERTFAQRLARFEEIKADNRSVRKTNQAERIADRLEQARNRTLPTMPKTHQPPHSPAVPAAEPSTPSDEPSASTPSGSKTFGRKRGHREH